MFFIPKPIEKLKILELKINKEYDNYKLINEKNKIESSLKIKIHNYSIYITIPSLF